MKRCVRTWCLVGAWIVSALLGMESQAQEKAKEKKPPRAALPPHVGEVLSSQQEKQARAIAEKYEPELDGIRDEIRRAEAALLKARSDREKFLEGVLTAEQKMAVKAYDAKIKSEAEKLAEDRRLLEDELYQVRSKRDHEIEALLTPEQKARLKEISQETKSKREANKKAKASAKAKPKEPTKDKAAPAPQ